MHLTISNKNIFESEKNIKTDSTDALSMLPKKMSHFYLSNLFVFISWEDVDVRIRKKNYRELTVTSSIKVHGVTLFNVSIRWEIFYD